MSSAKYISKSAELNALLKQVNHNNVTLEDHHNALKIVLSLSLLEAYQDKNAPDKKGFKQLMKAQEHLIVQTDSLTPKY